MIVVGKNPRRRRRKRKKVRERGMKESGPLVKSCVMMRKREVVWRRRTRIFILLNSLAVWRQL
jgi:hypothetical protein